MSLFCVQLRPDLSRHPRFLGQQFRPIVVDYREMGVFSCKNVLFIPTFCHRPLCFHAHSRIDLDF
jgi:hypothetical protein